MTIHFSNPGLFDPEEIVYVYVVDPASIPDDKKVRVDALQVAALCREIVPVRCEAHRAGEVFMYYRRA